MISLLKKGNTGNEILEILEALSDNTVTNTQQENVPTLDVIEFWWIDREIVSVSLDTFSRVLYT